MLVRTVSDPMALAPMVSTAIHQLQPQQSIEATASLGQVIEEQLHDVGIITALNAGVGLLCLALSILGLYAATATLVAARRRELALRLALGASPARILGMLLPRRLALVTLGTLLGAVIAQLALAQAVRSEYGGHQPIGPGPVVVAALLVCLPVLVAGVWGPGAPPGPALAHAGPAARMRASRNRDVSHRREIAAGTSSRPPRISPEIAGK